MTQFKILIAIFPMLILTSSLDATLKTDKITLKGNMIVEYKQVPNSVNTFSEIFSEGILYGRLRTNIFLWDWQGNTGTDNKALGVGASLIYKTAPLSGLSATLGMYTSQNPSFFREDIADLGNLKAGKDTLSRSDTTLTGNYGMSVVAQSYLQYNISKISIFAGRQLFESVFTASNDTKMIPNTFEGISASIKDVDKTDIKLAYFTKQKLRDHTVSHDVLAYGDWTNNDDSAANKNLTVEKIGNNNALFIVAITNNSLQNLKLNLSYMSVVDVVSNATFESHYSIPITSEWTIVPALRYMKQFDNLNSDTNVASLKNDTHIGYKNPTSLDSSLLALRLDVKSDAFLARIGYSNIADKADIIAPWRGFPTGGFTRAMAQYNWYANTKTYMIRAGYDFSKAKIIPGFSIMARYAIEDFDDAKDGVQADSNIIHIDARQNVTKNLEAKIRVGLVTADDSILMSDGISYKSDVSYNEYRFELNYFF